MKYIYIDVFKFLSWILKILKERYRFVNSLKWNIYVKFFKSFMVK